VVFLVAALYSLGCIPEFQRNILPSSSGLKCGGGSGKGECPVRAMGPCLGQYEKSYFHGT
jgi:hypothetical protein